MREGVGGRTSGGKIEGGRGKGKRRGRGGLPYVILCVSLPPSSQLV